MAAPLCAQVMKLKLDWFLLSMAATVLLAWAAPDPGSSGGWLHADILTKIGVALIFFCTGCSCRLHL